MTLTPGHHRHGSDTLTVNDYDDVVRESFAQFMLDSETPAGRSSGSLNSVIKYAVRLALGSFRIAARHILIRQSP